MSKKEKVTWFAFIVLFMIALALAGFYSEGKLDENNKKAIIYGNQQTANTLLLFNSTFYK